MSDSSASLKKKAKDWLRLEAYPLWATKGIDRETGRFHEALEFDCRPADVPLRAMVQARQIYSFVQAEKYGDIPSEEARGIVRRATDHFVKTYQRLDGSIRHAVDRAGKTLDDASELYTQAFAIFALGHAFSLVGDAKYRDAAKKVLAYLRRERAAKGGGFTEKKSGKTETTYESNPHMHLFESAIAWMQADTSGSGAKDGEWRKLADEIVELFRTKFVDSKIGALTEHFVEGWEPKREGGNYIFEPGHHFEWAWLIGNYLAIVDPEGKDAKGLNPIRRRLFELAEKHGIRADRKAAIDEVWSDFRPKKSSSRFWPQTERIKIAVQLGEMRVADESVDTLFRYIDAGPAKGLWMDTWLDSTDANAEWSGNPVKASSLYHIAGALYEYLRLRG